MSFLCALSAFSQSGPVIDSDNAIGEQPSFSVEQRHSEALILVSGSADSATKKALDPATTAVTANSAAIQMPRAERPIDFDRSIYYRNKLEFSLDAGYLPINIPFPLDIFVGDAYNTYPLQYTLVPIIASLRWHINGVGGPSILRGNFDLTFSGSVTAIPRGPETRYFSYDMGIRRNFVPHRAKIAPYFDIRLGVGNIDAKGPLGVPYAQGEDLTFTVNMGSGVRYNFSPRYALSAGLNFMHISNLDLSQGNGKPNWGIRNYGINVYGPMIGLDIQLRRHSRQVK
jgi:Lipid A 3-O-deacylase (PagL)